MHQSAGAALAGDGDGVGKGVAQLAQPHRRIGRRQRQFRRQVRRFVSRTEPRLQRHEASTLPFFLECL